MDSLDKKVLTNLTIEDQLSYIADQMELTSIYTSYLGDMIDVMKETLADIGQNGDEYSRSQVNKTFKFMKRHGNKEKKKSELSQKRLTETYLCKIPSQRN